MVSFRVVFNLLLSSIPTHQFVLFLFTYNQDRCKSFKDILSRQSSKTVF